MAVVQAFFLAGGHTEFAAAVKNNQQLMEDLFAIIEDLMHRYGLESALFLQNKGMHKQHANRVLEPYAFHTVVVTATHWRNFFGLRASSKAQPEAQDFGIAIAKAIMASKPRELSEGQWHLPYIREEDRNEILDEFALAEASAGKCARVSYLTQDGVRSLEKDIELARSLQRSGHMSPFQHPARPREEWDSRDSHGNYSPVWTQFRKLFPGEGDFTKLVSKGELVLGCRGDEALADFILSYPE
jgi:thymidylate synthase ThyX